MALNRDDEENPFAAPQSDIAPESFLQTTDGFVYADFGTRFVAAFIDGIILGVVGFGLGLVGTIALGQSTGAQVMINILSIVIGWLYSALQESSDARATLGKRAMGIRVLNLAGQQISFGQATGRHFGKFISTLILLIGYLMQPFTKRKQALHDIMAGCIVVKG